MWINDSLFLEKEIPKLHPHSYEYVEYWREQKKRCIEGYWVGGKWMPGNLYFYINFGTILLNRSKNSKVKEKGRPLLMDIFWDTSYYWLEARGLTGFSKQVEVNEYVQYLNNPFATDEELAEKKAALPNIRELLQTSTVDLGKPIFASEAKNLIWLANRGPGKSYFAATAVIAHEWLFDGLKEYNPGVVPPSTEVLVGAGDSKYSADLLKKVRLTLENLPGGMEINGIYYPPPLSKQYTGTWQPGKEIIHRYKKKVGGKWVFNGTGSTIKHRTYKDDPFAAQGTRPAVAVKEEIGMFDNLRASHEADVETQKMGTMKFGSTLFMGTGGDMESGTVDAHTMFYDPDTYDCIAFDDTWEHKGKIGYFLPATHGKLQYKDKDGKTRVEFAMAQEQAERERIRRGKNASTALDGYVQYNPLVPSEMFLTKSGNIFPKKELSEWLAELENNKKYENSEFIGSLSMDDEGKVIWRPDLANKLHPIRKFPLDTKKEDIEGAVVIWEHPERDQNGDIPFGLYVAGTDPYDHDESGTPSLGSTFIYKRFYSLGTWNEVVVAEYTGRPKANEYYRNLINLLLYYNARVLYENEKKGLHQYAEMHNYDYLLIDQPGYIKDIIQNSSVNRVKGMHMVEALKTHGETLIKNWLEEEYAPGRMNLTKLRSVPLIKELIAYNRDGNFDRCLVRNTNISTIHGFKKVQDITLDDYVLTHTGKYRKVTNLDNHITTKDLVVIDQVGDYKTLTVTDNHPIYVAYTRYKKHSKRTDALNNITFLDAKDLKYKYQFGLVPKRKGLMYNNLSDDVLYALGWIMSDGYISDRDQIRITLQLNQEHIADKLIPILNNQIVYERPKVFNGRTYEKFGASKKVVKTKTGGYILVTITSSELAKVARRFGYRANDKRINMQYFTTCNLMPFVIGFLEGDGHQKLNAKYDGYKREVIECSGIYEDLMRQIRQILVDNGVWSSIRRVEKRNGGKEQYSISISGGYINKLLSFYPSLKFKVVESQAEKNTQLETEEGFWTPIKSIIVSSPKTTSEGELVYNFEVAEDHTYVADGIVTHNCMAFMLTMYALQEKKRLVGDVSESYVPVHKSEFFDSVKFKRFSVI